MMKYTIVLLLISLSFFSVAQDSTFDHVVFWLAADSVEGETPSQLYDVVSGANSTVSSSVSNVQEELLDSHKVLTFSGESSFDFPLNVEIPFTTFILYRTDNPMQQMFFDSENRMIGYLVSTTAGQYGANLGYSFDESPDFVISSFTCDSEMSRIHRNGELVGSGQNDRSLQNTFRIGSAWPDNRYYIGDIAEVLIFDMALTDEDRVIVETYFKEKYAGPPSLGQDFQIVPGCNTTLEVKNRFKSYAWYEIGGESDILIGSGGNQINIDSPGTYMVETISIFDEISRDTIDVFAINVDDLDDNTICEFIGYDIDLGIFDPTILIDWSDESLSGSEVTISTPGTYSVVLTQGDGCVYESNTFQIEDLEGITQITQPELVCVGNELGTSVSDYVGMEFLWNTDEETAFIEPQASGEYWVEATNANGCVGRDTVQIDMAGIAPTVEMEIGVACETREVAFADATAPEEGVIIEQTWTFPFGSAQGAEVEQTFDLADDYPVILDVLLDNGCTGQKRDTVHVKHLPLVEFNYDAVIPCAGNEVAFESQSAVPGGGQIDAYAWEFSNETTDTGIVGSTIFEELGTESVLHIVQTTDGCIDSLEVPVVVLGSPIVEFEFDTVCIGLATSFQEMVDTEESGPVFYQWQFGDGFFSNFPNTSHEYAAPGVYEVTLTATGNDFGNAGCVDAQTRQVRVFPAPDAAISLEDGCLNTGAMLVDITQASEVGGAIDPIAVRSWEVVVGPDLTEVIGGDSVQIFQPEGGGISTILFSYETEAGCEGGTNGSVQVLPIPQSVFSLEVPNEAPPVSAIPENLSVDATLYAWAIDGEVVSNDESPLLFFPDTGTYVVELVAQNELGCSDASSQGVTVIVPQVDIALLDISFEQKGTRLELTALLSNYGNVPITTFDLEVQIGQTINFSQEVVETILPGEVVPYSLSADFQYTPGRILPYTCMTVSNPNGVGDEELNLENNSACIGLDKERVTFIKPFPNPVGDVLHLEFVLPKDGEMEVKFVSSDGKEMGVYSFELEEGYAKSEIDMSSYAEGMYVIQYEFEGEVHTERVVVAK